MLFLVFLHFSYMLFLCILVMTVSETSGFSFYVSSPAVGYVGGDDVAKSINLIL